MPFTDYGASKLLAYVFAGDDGTGDLPLTLYIGLFSTATDASGGGTELSGDGYARTAIGAPWVDSGTGRGIANDDDITTPVATLDWDAATHVAFYDDPTTGNSWYYAELISPITVLQDKVGRFAAGDIVLELTT